MFITQIALKEGNLKKIVYNYLQLGYVSILAMSKEEEHKPPMHVGTPVVRGSKRMHPYKNVRYEKDGWVSPLKYLPRNYDLVHIRMVSPTTARATRFGVGWYDGEDWVSLKLITDDKVNGWKLHESTIEGLSHEQRRELGAT